jgi:hypothetical protein
LAVVIMSIIAHQAKRGGRAKPLDMTAIIPTPGICRSKASRAMPSAIART